MPASINLLWEVLHNNDTEVAPHLLGDVLSQASSPGEPRSTKVHANCVACATALAAGWPLTAAGAFAQAAISAAGDDDNLRAVALLFSGRVLVAKDDYELALSQISEALRLTPPSARAFSRLRGSLVLLLAVLMERRGDDDRRWENEIDRAYNLADQLDPDDPDPWHTEFSTANVSVHRIHLLVRRGRLQEAREAFDASDFSGLSEERRSSLAADTAHFQVSLAHVADLMENLALALDDMTDMVPYVPEDLRAKWGYDKTIAELTATVSKFEGLYGDLLGTTKPSA
jgi:tetratricopeptide (TPR) repeat protein